MVTRRSESRGCREKSDAVPRSMVAQLNEPKSKLTDLAYQMIEEAIVTLRIRPGTALSEQALSEMTGIGRTPIRRPFSAGARAPRSRPAAAQAPGVGDERQQTAQAPGDKARDRALDLPQRRQAGQRFQAPVVPASRRRVCEVCCAERRCGVRPCGPRVQRAVHQCGRNEFAEGAMRMLHGLSRRFWYLHYKQTADMPEMARLHAAVAVAISNADIEGGGSAIA